MGGIIEFIDKSGRKIHISPERWSHILQHPEMTNQTERIRETLLQPDVILNSSTDQQVHYYFRYYKERREYLFVSVKYLNGEGFIITAFYTNKVTGSKWKI